MFFTYPNLPHARKHGPKGYLRYTSYKDWLRDEFSFRCVYCLFRERNYPNGQAAFGVDHQVAKSAWMPWALVYENLVYACNLCNSAKGIQPVLDPCFQAFSNHLRVLMDGTLIGLSVDGNDLIDLLHLNRPNLIEKRLGLIIIEQMVQRASSSNLTLAEQAQINALKNELRYPLDLPDLGSLMPPRGNIRSAGVLNCFFALRAQGLLPDTY